jgi:7-cyano-7-deazaguanine reductase
MYLLAYRNMGIFQENAVNRILDDCVKACRPREMTVTGEFTPRGGVYSTITADYVRGRTRRR